MAKTDRPTGIQSQSRKRVPVPARDPEGFHGVYLTPEAFATAVDARVKALWPDLVRDLLTALVQRMQGEGRAAAMAAIAEPTDELVLSALADWCEERQLPELGARVRRLRLERGDLLVVSRPAMNEAAGARLDAVLDDLHRNLHEDGRGVHIVTLPDSIDLHAFRLRGK